MDFMTSRVMNHKSYEIRVSRCGYTGEDGFEISIPEALALSFAEDLAHRKDDNG